MIFGQRIARGKLARVVSKLKRRVILKIEEKVEKKTKIKDLILFWNNQHKNLSKHNIQKGKSGRSPHSKNGKISEIPNSSSIQKVRLEVSLLFT